MSTVSPAANVRRFVDVVKIAMLSFVLYCSRNIMKVSVFVCHLGHDS
jgi:hypothetical protein